MGSRVLGLAALMSATLAAGCANVATGPATKVQLQPTRGHETRGSVEFRARDGGVDVIARVSGLAPGPHGFHVHEKGDCSAPDATSAGGHFDPDGKPHGHPGQGAHHLGDLPTLQADAGGNATLEAFLPGLRLGHGPTGLAGRALVVHAAADDFKSQPAGNSGARVACGVVASH